MNYNRVAIVRYLIENGAAIDSMTPFGRSSLGWAVQKGVMAIMRLLLERGVNIEVRDWLGCTPLYSAVECGREDVVQLLLEAGANVKTRNNRGDDLLASSPTEEIRLLLAEYAAKIGHRFDSKT